MSISDLGFGAIGRHGFAGLSDIHVAKAKVYSAILGFSLIVLATPLALVLGLKALLDLPQPLFLPLGVGILAADLYLAAWMSRLFAAAPRSLRLPRPAAWRLPAGIGWKLAVILLVAPWPFDAALALLGDHPAIYAQLAVFLLAAAVALASIAVLLAVLAEAWKLAQPKA
ncbi:MAG TPA: hypothetical protein VFS04_01725 [Alphaproteobacteria bacterium]|nr:hypothetical protein [Alphaproteobacteria bacterium]